MLIREARVEGNFLICGDTHDGNPTVSEECKRKFVEIAKKRRIPWIHLGDGIEAIPPTDKRFSIDEHKKSVLQQMEGFVEWIKPVASTSLGFVRGNHEEKLSTIMGDLAFKMAKDAGIPYLTDTCYYTLRSAHGSNLCFFTHRGRLGRYRSGKAQRIMVNEQISLEEGLRKFDGDLCAIGHYHHTVCSPCIFEKKLTVVDGHLSRILVPIQRTWYCVCPTMHLIYNENAPVGSYAERNVENPNDVGWLEVHCNKKTGKIEAIEEIDSHGKVEVVFKQLVLR